MLFAWLAAEKAGGVNRQEACDLQGEPPVGGSGLSELLTVRSLPYADVLMLMMTVSDNLCTNLVIRRLMPLVDESEQHTERVVKVHPTLCLRRCKLDQCQVAKAVEAVATLVLRRAGR